GGLTLIGAGMDSTELRNDGSPTLQIRCEQGDLSISDMMFSSQPASPYPIAVSFYSKDYILSVVRCKFLEYEDAVASTAAFFNLANCVFHNCGSTDGARAIYVSWGSGNGRFANNTFI